MSVIITCYNQGHWLVEAIESALASTYREIEILVIDDGSTDPETRTLLTQLNFPKTQLICQPNKGVSYARNLGLTNARGEFVLCLDADDVLCPTYIEHALAVFRAHPSCNVVTGDFANLFADGKRSAPVLGWQSFDHQYFIEHGGIVVSSLFRREAGLAAGGFSRVLNRLALEDYEFWLTLYERNPDFRFLPEVGLLYRQHGPSRNNHKIKRLLARIWHLINHPRLYLRHPRILISILWGFWGRRWRLWFRR
ncbi:MAG: glycosyltransferase family 2 protein [Candidatus Spyradenecus sp.]